jgi:hypothetical protein
MGAVARWAFLQKERKNKMKFRLKDKVGSHFENGKEYKSGEVVNSNNDLIALFPEKFEKVNDSSEEKESSDSPKNYGTNVTKNFPEAIELGVTIFRKRNEGFFVIDEDGTLCNSESITTKASLSKFLRSLEE